MDTPSEPPSPPPVRLDPVPDSRLEQLMASYETLKARAKDAADRFAECSEAIKAEVRAQAPHATAITVAGTAHWPSLRLVRTDPWRLDVKRLKKENPGIYAAYARRSPDGSWVLREENS